MQDQQQIDHESEDLKPLANRIKHVHWQVRKRAYEAVQTNLEQVSNVKEEFRINNEFFTPVKLTSLLNNIVEEKHPILVLKGLQCVLRIIKMGRDTTRYFNKLVCEGLEKFPLLTQQRKQILQKFMDILQYFRDQQNLVATLNTKLTLPNQKSVMWVIEVIGALEIVSLKKKLIEISKKHPKKDVKDLAAEIAQQLVQNEPMIEKQVKAKTVVSKGGMVKKQQPKKMIQLLDKIHSYEQLISKDQQKFAEQLLESIDQISVLPSSPQLTNFSYYIQLMIEDNNQIISMGGVKMLTVLIRNRSQLLPQSYPLLFIFRKFKMHKTHATNLHLFRLVEQILCSHRNLDLLSAISQGMCSAENKVNLKYGCVMSFIRVFCIYYQQFQLFEKYCIGEYSNLIDRLQNKKQLQKMIVRCFQIFSKQKDRQYQPAIDKMKEVLGLSNSTQKLKTTSPQELGKTLIRNKSNDPQIKTKPTVKPNNPAKTTNINLAMTESPEGELNKINEMLANNKFTESTLKKAIEKCLKCLEITINKLVFDMFYYCQIAQCFIDQYRPNQASDQLISQFLINYLTVVSNMVIKQNKKKSKITQKGVEYLLKISITKLVLSKNLLDILDNLNTSVGYEVILVCLGSLLVMSRQVAKKKNKKYLNKWLEQYTPQEFINNQYFQIKQALQANGETKIKKIETPSIINLPTYQQLKNNTINLDYVQTITASNQHYRLQQRQQQQQERPKKNKRVIEQKPPKEEEIIRKGVEQLEMFENADISNIEQIDEQQTDRIDERWDYFLNKKLAAQQQQRVRSADSTPRKAQYSHHSQQQKFEGISNKSDESQSSSFRDKLSVNHYQDRSESKQPNNIELQNQESSINIKQQEKAKTLYLQENNKNKSNTIASETIFKKQEGIKYYYSPEQQEGSEEDEHQFQKQQNKQQFKYVYLDQKRITYMLSNSGKSFSHLRTLVFNPFKKQLNKQAFLRELTHLIQNQVINKPEPYKSLLLLVIILFTEIKSDKTIIEPLQFLYEYMAQHCSNNQFLKTIIGLYHCAIQQTEEGERKFILTIMTKSMVRIMPYVQNAVELLRDFQQFYQIGELVYFEMYQQEYQHIRSALQHSQNLSEVVGKAFEQQGDNLKSIVQGWLQSGFKKVVKVEIEHLLQQVQEETQP